MKPITITTRAALHRGVSASFVLLLMSDAAASEPVATLPGTQVLAVAQEQAYADGTYTATGWYGSLPSSVTVTVALEGGIITEVAVMPHATNPTSLNLQRRFADTVPAVVLGRPIAEVNVGRLAGSTGTPDGFNDALQQIREQAMSGD